MGCLSVVFNIIWILTGGWLTALAFFLAGVLCYITIIGIPLGRQAFKMAHLTLAPFGKTITYGGGAPSLIANVIWVVLVGLWTAIGYVIEGALFCCTIVGIPFGLQLFKMAKLALCPFGTTVN